MVNSDIYTKMKIAIHLKKISEILDNYKNAKKRLLKVIIACLDLIKIKLYINY